jgi:hypothetical protein
MSKIKRRKIIMSRLFDLLSEDTKKTKEEKEETLATAKEIEKEYDAHKAMETPDSPYVKTPNGRTPKCLEGIDIDRLVHGDPTIPLLKKQKWEEAKKYGYEFTEIPSGDLLENEYTEITQLVELRRLAKKIIFQYRTDDEIYKTGKKFVMLLKQEINKKCTVYDNRSFGMKEEDITIIRRGDKDGRIDGVED